MIDKTDNTTANKFGYRSPKIKEVPVAVQNVLCSSPDENNSNGDFDSYNRETFEL